MKDALTIKAYRAAKTLITRRLTVDYDRIPYRFDDLPLKKILSKLGKTGETG